MDFLLKMVIFWGYPPPINSDLFIFMVRASQPKPSRSLHCWWGRGGAPEGYSIANTLDFLDVILMFWPWNHSCRLKPSWRDEAWRTKTWAILPGPGWVWLGYVGDEILPIYIGIIIDHKNYQGYLENYPRTCKWLVTLNYELCGDCSKL